VTHPDDPTGGAAQPAFDELGRLNFAEHSLQSVVDKVTQLAARFLPGEPATSVTIVVGNRPRTVAASAELATDLDVVQYRLGDGPCLSAATTGTQSLILDTRSPEQWAAFAREASERGCGSVLSHPLPVQEKVAGALNVYARELSTGDRQTLDLVSRFAAYAVVPVSNMYLYESAVERVGHLEAALDSRAVIDQAKGILMERFKFTADHAFQVLAQVSMEHNTKVRDVAQQFVETGELPPV
jgi:GAF domain-containing protein